MKNSVCENGGAVALAIMSLMSIPASLLGQEAATEKTTEIIGGLATGEAVPAKAQTPKKQPVYQIRKTLCEHKNGSQITIHEIDPPVATPRRQTEHAPAVKESSPQPHPVTEIEPMRMIFLSATVYGHDSKKLTKLTLFHQGKQCEAWSNIDFHHLDGFPAFRVENREYMKLMTVLNARGGDRKIKTIAEATSDGYPVGTPLLNPRDSSFTVTKIDPEDTHSRRILADIHRLYRKQKHRLESAYELRKKNAKNNQQKQPIGNSAPKPITIHFWKRDVVKEREQKSINNADEGRAE